MYYAIKLYTYCILSTYINVSKLVQSFKNLNWNSVFTGFIIYLSIEHKGKLVFKVYIWRYFWSIDELNVTFKQNLRS